jgi:3-oxoacyl-(acyl-carrier-protein) synthase
MGMVSAIGGNVAENHAQLRAGQSGIGKSIFFDSIYAHTLPFGEIQMNHACLKKTLGIPDGLGYTRTCIFAIQAFEEAIQNALLTADVLQLPCTAFITASTVGGMCMTDQLYEDANLKSAGSEFLESYDGSSHALKIVKRYGITGITDTINTACSSSANAILLGTRLIRSGRAKRVIVGGVDTLAKYTVNGFNALKILSDQPCQPFDQNRKGLNLGEAAAYLVLEDLDDVQDKPIYAEITGYGNSNDAFHPSGMSEGAIGAIQCMQEALRCGGLEPQQIDYINAHGTGTLNNDQVESYALSQLFEHTPSYSSTKSFTGHTLGAAGAVEAIYSILSILHSEIYPSLRVETPIHDFTISPETTLQKNRNIDHVLSNSFGFGGNCTSILISKFKS